MTSPVGTHGLRAVVAALALPLILGSCGRSGAEAGRHGAERGADRLVGLVVPPEGAVPMAAVPPGLTGPAYMPGEGSSAERARFWRLDMSFAQARSWVAAARPGGLAVTGSPQSGRGDKVIIDGRAYDAAAQESFSWAQLQLNVTADGDSASFLRADGVDVWRDPGA